MQRKQTKKEGSKSEQRKVERKLVRLTVRKETKKIGRSENRRTERKQRGNTKKVARKQKRKKKRKLRKTKMRKVEKSRLGRSIPSDKMEVFTANFQRGKERVRGEDSMKFLGSIELPFSSHGRLRSDYRQLVREKVIDILPDYCEEARMSREDKWTTNCARRAKRIRERIQNRNKIL